MAILDSGVGLHSELPAIYWAELELAHRLGAAALDFNGGIATATTFVEAMRLGSLGIGHSLVESAPWPSAHDRIALAEDIRRAVLTVADAKWPLVGFGGMTVQYPSEVLLADGFVGALRLLSPLSVSVADGTLPSAIEDDSTHIHGRQMAGIVAGLSNQGSYSSLLALAPWAEVVAIRICEQGGPQVSEIVDGLEWAATKAQCDIGLIAYACPALSRTDTHALEMAVKAAFDDGMIVVAGAGNVTNTSGPRAVLAMPSAAPLASAVTGVRFDQAVGVSLADCSHHSTASTEPVAFCAFSGDGDHYGAVLTAGPLGGYGLAHGTSVAAAIATGLIAAAIGRWRMRERARELYDWHLVKQRFGIPPWHSWTRVRDPRMVLSRAAAAAVPTSRNPAPERFGAGIVREFDI